MSPIAKRRKMSPIGKRRKMKPIGKRGHLIGDSAMPDDLISNLPVDLLSCILDRIPIRDAARSSVLSTNWRNVWQSRRNIILQQSFIKQLISKKDLLSPSWYISNAVNKILLAHKGPIIKFVLHIPDYIIINPLRYGFWTSLISTKGVKYISITDETIFSHAVMPSQLFSCSELVHLQLMNYKLDAPPNFQGFRNLTLVYLSYVTFIIDVSFGPQLNHLSLYLCSGLQHLARQFTHHNKNLTKFELLRSTFYENFWAKWDGKGSMFSMKECINLRTFLSSSPNIATLILNSLSLTFLDPKQTKVVRLKMAMKNMKTLVLYNVDFYDLCQISNMLCLVRSSPNLQSLKISVGNKVKRLKPVELAAEQYYKCLHHKKMVLEQHYTVEIGQAENSKAEILFRNYIRASSPALKRLYWHRRTIFAERIKGFDYN